MTPAEFHALDSSTQMALTDVSTYLKQNNLKLGDIGDQEYSLFGLTVDDNTRGIYITVPIGNESPFIPNEKQVSFIMDHLSNINKLLATHNRKFNIIADYDCRDIAIHDASKRPYYFHSTQAADYTKISFRELSNGSYVKWYKTAPIKPIVTQRMELF